MCRRGYVGEEKREQALATDRNTHEYALSFSPSLSFSHTLCPYTQTSIKSTSITLVWGRNLPLQPFCPPPFDYTCFTANCCGNAIGTLLGSWLGLRVGDFEFDFDFDLFNNLAGAAVEANKPYGKL